MFFFKILIKVLKKKRKIQLKRLLRIPSKKTNRLLHIQMIATNLYMELTRDRDQNMINKQYIGKWVEL